MKQSSKLDVPFYFRRVHVLVSARLTNRTHTYSLPKITDRPHRVIELSLIQYASSFGLPRDTLVSGQLASVIDICGGFITATPHLLMTNEGG